MHAPGNPALQVYAPGKQMLSSCGSSSYAPGKRMVECRSGSGMPLARGVDLTSLISQRLTRCMYVLVILYRI